ncbi:MAG: alpha-2-macroglobulin family protein [Bauldia sp.]
MLGMVRWAARISAAAFALTFLLTPDLLAADKRIITTKNADYTGFDYNTLKGVTMNACQQACTADNKCAAFTFNEKANWCFLKSDFGPLATAQNTTAGRVVELPVPQPTLEKTRLADIAFLPSSYVDEARRLAGGLKTLFPPGNAGYHTLLQNAARARSAGNIDAAAKAYGQALAVSADDPQTWLLFAVASLDRKPTQPVEKTTAVNQATAAAVAAFLRADGVPERAQGLALIGNSLARREAWKASIRAYKASLGLKEDAGVRAAYEVVAAEHGFRIAKTEVDADVDAPRICVVFSDPLPKGRPGLADFVTVEGGPGLSVEAEETQICIDGVKHGGRYHIRVRAGLPNTEGDTIAKTADLNVFVRDRAPWVGFAGKAYVLPAGAAASIPIASINTDKADAVIYRIGDRNLATAVRDGVFLSELDGDAAEQIAESDGEKVWEGQILIEPKLNETVTTGIPIGKALPQMKPGAYVITTRLPVTKARFWEPEATQWFVVSDLGLTALSGHDGVHTLVRSLASAQPVANATVRLVAVNNEVLGQTRTDADGHAVFAPGLARGTRGMAPQLIVVETAAGDYAFLDVAKTAFDLTDRGVDGRPAPEALDVFMKTERGVYRPGEAVHVTALVRNAKAVAVGDLPLTLMAERPDGVEFTRRTLNDGGLGGYKYELALPGDAMRGSWTIRLYSDPKGSPVATTTALVEDFVPERLAFEISTKAEQFSAQKPTAIDIAARYLYGAKAPGLTVEGDIVVRPATQLKAYPGYRFGRADDDFERIKEPIEESAETDAEGNATLDVALPQIKPTTRLLEAEAILRLADLDGRAVERRLALPVQPSGPRIGIKPGFDDNAAPEGGPATFNLIEIGPDGKRVAARGATWTVNRLVTTYQWYRNNGTWSYEPITSTRRVAGGTIDIGTGDPASISAPVDYGRFRLEVTVAGANPASSTYEFNAGWYVAGAGTDTPDVLAVALDKPAYRVGETARLRLDPRFAGTALVMVIDDRVIAMKAVDVPANGTSVDLPVTDEWGPGAYVTAALYRPMNIEQKQMPARALGLTWGKVAPGDRNLAVALALPTESRPRGPLAVPVSIGNLAPGTEAYVTVAAVDVGILNLTNYKPPAPDEWYFGQRRLGIEIRDLYGQLIDGMQGVPGAVRSGGDESPAALGAPPPTEKLVAYQSGIVRVGPDGRATVSFDMPDFNGTVRVMAMAWSRDGVGHAVKDVFVRDPVVVAAGLPRFLHTGDTSRLMLDINNVAGSAGTYAVSVAADGLGIATADANRSIRLEAAGRQTVNVPISGAAVGDHPIRVTLTTPEGQQLTKDLVLGVRPPEEPLSRTNIVALNAGQRLTVNADALTDMIPGTTNVSVAVGPAGRFDLPALLAELDRYPYGCAEQITSRALPLLYLNDVARAVGIAADSELRKRVQTGISGVLAKQTSSGAFGLWGPRDGDEDLWLDAYVTDFLLRADQAGYELPAVGKTLAIDNLANKVAIAKDFTNGGTDIAYALYVLARAGRAQIGDLRYYAESKLNAFATPLAKAQIGAALALYGDKVRAETAFRAAVTEVRASRADAGYREDYGSTLRDSAAILTLAAETAQSSVDVRTLAGDVATLRNGRRYLSTQEESWMLLAAAAMIKDLQRPSLTLDGLPFEGSLFRRFDGAAVRATPVVIANAGSQVVDALITASGVPTVAPPASGNGFKIERAYFRTDGKPANVATVGQNERFVVTVTVTADRGVGGRLMIVDPLPAGFEIENPNLSASGDTATYDWLDADTEVAHTEARTDRFVAAVTRSSGDPVQFKVAYSVRAVSPGKFVAPAATVEDMYRPDRRARSASGRVEVVGTTLRRRR